MLDKVVGTWDTSVNKMKKSPSTEMELSNGQERNNQNKHMAH